MPSKLGWKRIEPEILFSWNTSQTTLTYRINEKIANHTLLLFHLSQKKITVQDSIYPFHVTGPLLYPLKTSKNLKVFWCFQWLWKEINCRKWLVGKPRQNSVYWFQSHLNLRKLPVLYNVYWLENPIFNLNYEETHIFPYSVQRWELADPEEYWEPSRNCQMELFAKIVNS